MGWIDLAQDTGQWCASCEHGYKLSDSIKSWEILQ
jgi:hypothetical protein